MNRYEELQRNIFDRTVLDNPSIDKIIGEDLSWRFATVLWLNEQVPMWKLQVANYHFRSNSTRPKTTESSSMVSYVDLYVGKDPVFSIVCSTCAHESRISATSPAVMNDQFTCCNCKCTVEPSRESVRKAISIAFLSWFRALEQQWSHNFSCPKIHWSEIPSVIWMLITISPYITARFVALRIGRMGHLMLNTWIYKTIYDNGDYQTVDICGHHEDHISNHTMLKLWKRQLEWSDWAMRILDILQQVPALNEHYYYLQSLNNEKFILDYPKHHDCKKIALSFDQKEIAFGEEYLKSFISDRNRSIVCVSNRDEAYLQKLAPTSDTSYHDYRNSSIANFIPAMKWLSEAGFTVLRMGSDPREKLTICNATYPNIIDYANNYRSDFLDAYIRSKCYVYVGDSSGAVDSTYTFGALCGLTNATATINLHLFAGAFIMPSKLWLCAECRYLTFSEIVNSPLYSASYSDEYTSHGVEVIKNSPQEILEFTQELIARKNGTWIETIEDQNMESRFNEIFSKKGEVVKQRISISFLRKNAFLLN